MNRGIRQGCPISAILYLFIAEILSIKVKENENIKGLQTDYLEKEVKKYTTCRWHDFNFEKFWKKVCFILTAKEMKNNKFEIERQ